MNESFLTPPIPEDPESKTVIPWKTKDTVFILLSVLCGILFSAWALFGGFHLGFTLAYLFLLIATTCYIGVRKLRPFPLICGIISAAASFLFLWINDGLLLFLWFCVIFLLFGIYTASLGGLKLRRGYVLLIDAMLTVVFVPLRFLARPFTTLKANNRDNAKAQSLMQIFIGLLLAFPIILIVVPLLIRSDAAFEGLMMNILGNFGEAIAKLIIGIGAALLIFSLWFALRKGFFTLPEGSGVPRHGILKLPAAITVLSVISVFYLAYLFSQLAYFFSAFSGILPEGYVFTPAEYARRGFFELCGVCFVNLTVLFLISLSVCRDKKRRLPGIVKVFNTVISVFSLIFTATALSKMVLYIDRFGLTRRRVLTAVFMIFLAGVMICVIIKSAAAKFPYMRCILILGCVIGLVLGFANPDKIIARYNVSQYLNGGLKTVDVAYLATLSDAAVPELGKLTRCEDDTVVRQTYYELYWKLKNYYVVEDQTVQKEIGRNGFSSCNVTCDKAKKTLYHHREQILRNYDESLEYAEDDALPF